MYWSTKPYSTFLPSYICLLWEIVRRLKVGAKMCAQFEKVELDGVTASADSCGRVGEMNGTRWLSHWVMICCRKMTDE